MTKGRNLAGNSRKQWGGMFGTKAAPVVDMGAFEAREAPSAGTALLIW